VTLSWSDLFAALALVFVIEGIVAFANPRGFRRLLLWASTCTERELRFAGLMCMLVGIVILFLAR
jgi:uncharacterized protein YjeT (DUF2065 family)